MNIFQRIGGIFTGGKASQIVESTKAPSLMPTDNVTTGSSGNSVMVRNMERHPVLQFLDRQQIDPNPRNGLIKFRWMMRQVGPYAAAENALKAFIGCPEIIAPEGSRRADKKLVQELNDWWAQMPIYGRYINDLSADHGLDSLVNAVFTATLSDGSAFTRRMQEQSTGRINKNPIEGIHLLDGADVDVLQDPSDLMREFYRWTPQQGGIIDMTSSLFAEFHLDNVQGYSWGVPLSYKGDIVAMQAMRALIAYIGSMELQANPIGITLISGEKKMSGVGMSGDDIRTQQKLEQQQNDQIFDKFQEGVRRRKIENTGQDLLLKLGYPANIQSSYYGQGMNPPRTFSQDANEISRQIAQFLPVPAAFLGISTGAAGIGSDLFRVQKSQMMAYIERAQRLMSRNLIMPLTNAHLVSQSVQVMPNQYSIHWEMPDIEDEKIEAETEKLEAETVALQLANAQNMFMTFSGSEGVQEAINQYLQECGLPQGLEVMASVDPNLEG